MEKKAPAVRVENVSLAFEDKAVLRDVSFEARSGETTVILGVTGTGKSLLLKMLVGLIRPDSGRIFVKDQEVSCLEESKLYPIRRSMGILFQEGALFDSLNVFENVSYRIREEKGLDEATLEDRVREVLRFVELEEAIDKLPSELSGGMRRRVALARAMIDQPPIMLYDSPTAGLDPVTANTIITLIVKLRDVNRVCSLLVTHRIQDAFVLARYSYDPSCCCLVPLNGEGSVNRGRTYFLVLREGSVYFYGRERELMASSDPYLRLFLV